MRLRETLICCAICVAVAACKPSKGAVELAPAPPAPAPTVHTQVEWKQATDATHEKFSVRDEGEGVVKYAACFGGSLANKKCGALAFVQRDGFRKVEHFFPRDSNMQLLLEESYVRTFVSLRDCYAPVVMFEPFFKAEHWMFMNRFSIMADGEVIIDRDISQPTPARNVVRRWVQESSQVVATALEIAALRKVPNAKTILLRLTGDKGYETIKNGSGPARNFQMDVTALLAFYDQLSAAAQTAVPNDCSK